MELTKERTHAWLNLVQTNRIVTDAMEQALDSVGLSVPEFELLTRISHAPNGRLRMIDVANLLLVSRSGVTKLVDRAEAAGLVERKLCPEDRRLTYATITEAGRAALDRAMPVFAEALDRSFSVHLTCDDVNALLASMRKVLEGNDAWREDRCSPTYG
jgi:DNA-binding MarR family transcriptional regulator